MKPKLHPYYSLLRSFADSRCDFSKSELELFQVEAVKIHYFVPRRHEIVNEFFLRVV